MDAGLGATGQGWPIGTVSTLPKASSSPVKIITRVHRYTMQFSPKESTNLRAIASQLSPNTKEGIATTYSLVCDTPS